MNCCPAARKLFLFALGLALVGGIVLTTSDRPSAAEEAEGKLLRHVVLFQFKDSASEKDVQKLVDEFRALPSKISEIADYEYGTNNSPENLADGLTHCFLVTFKTEADRDAYLPHPAHQAFVKVLLPHLEKAVVVDYWSQK